MRQLAGSSLVAGFRQWFGRWYQDNVVATQTAVVLAIDGSVAAFSTSVITMLRPGSITGVIVKSNAARIAGTLTVEVYKNGSAIGLTAVIDGTNTTFKATTQNVGDDTFVAGDEIGVRITTSADWSPTTADIQALVEVTL